MKVLWLGPTREEMIGFLEAQGETVVLKNEPFAPDSNFLNEIDFIISYGYRHILKKPLLDKFKNRAINLHIALLPWNRGADPNLWSFLENTPKGVTLHMLAEGVDAGDILSQQEVLMDSNETLRSSYAKLSAVMQNLFMHAWPKIREGKIKALPQLGKGSYHRMLDRNAYEFLLTKGWDTPVADLVGKALNERRAK